MFTNDELIIIQTLLEDIKDLTIDESRLLDKIHILVEFDEVKKEYDEKRKSLSDKLNDLQSK